MSIASSLSVLVGAQTKPLEKGLKKAGEKVQEFSKSASSTLSSMTGLGPIIAGALAGATVAAAFKYCIGSFQEVEDAQLKLGLALKATSGQAGVSVGEVTAFAQQLSKTTQFSAAATISAGAALARFQNIKGPNFTDTLKAASNYAVVMGKDLPSAAASLGSALQAPRDGWMQLAAEGVKFSDAQVELIESMTAAGDVAGSQAVILQALDAQYAEASEMAGNTLSTKMTILRNSVDAVAASIGEGMIPYVKTLVDWVTQWVQSIDLVKTKSTVFEWTAKAIGYVADAAQMAQIGFQSALVQMENWLSKGSRLLANFLEMAAKVSAYIPGVEEGTSKTLKDASYELKKLAAELNGAHQQGESKLSKMMEAPKWSETTANWTNDLGKQTEEAKTKFESLGKVAGDAIKDGPVAAMHQFTSAQLDAQKQIRDMTEQLKTFGQSSFAITAAKAKQAGASKDQIAALRKLGAQLEGKQLAQSLQNPFEKFEREMKKLEELKSAGGIDAQTYQRAKTKLTTDLQGSLPQFKNSAGGALTAGSAELRSSLINFRGRQMSQNPQTQMKMVLDNQLEQQRLANTYLRALSNNGLINLPAAPII